jgi:ankyrin repeat protein
MASSPATKRSLFRAISRGDLESFTRILQQNRELTNYCDARDLLWHIPPLHWACRYGRVSFVQVLVEQHGANVNIQDALGRTALYIATYYGQCDLVQLLLDHDADLNIMDQSGESPLAIACNFGLLQIVQKLLDHGAAVNTKDQTGHTPLFRAICSKNNADVMVEGLLDHGAHVNDVHNSSGETPLHRATTQEVIELLLNRGAHLNAQDHCGTTPLLQAVQHENVPVAKLLLDHGANLNIADNKGVTPFVHACRSRTPSLVYLLLGKSPHVWSTCWNALHPSMSDEPGRKQKQSQEVGSSRMAKVRKTGEQPVSVL